MLWGLPVAHSVVGRSVDQYGLKSKISDEGAWKCGRVCEKEDREYLLKNICRHLQHDMSEENKLVVLLSRPEWMSEQVVQNGIVQNERDVLYGCEWIRRRERVSLGKRRERNEESTRLGIKELEMVRGAV